MSSLGGTRYFDVLCRVPDFVMSDHVLEVFHSFRQIEADVLEAGGVLLGSLYEKNEIAFVEAVSTPLPGDNQSRRSYYRSSSHNKVIQKYWKERGGYGHALGIWHSHPEDIPTPSAVDLADWRRALRGSRFESKCLYFVIVGRAELGVWAALRSAKFLRVGRFRLIQMTHHDGC